jgi:hypothetical protein
VSCRVKAIFDAFVERSGSAAILRNKNELNQLSGRLLCELLVKLAMELVD